MKISSEIESRKNRLKTSINFGCGFLFGLVLFGLGALNILRHGFDAVNTFTWIALAFGVLAFAFLAGRFGDDFWNLFRN